MLIIYYIILLLLVVLIIQALHYKTNHLISIVIPCIPRDIKYLDRLLNSIKNQTYLPHEVIIALSGISQKESRLLETKLKTPKFPIYISGTATKKYASENRNRGAYYATGDIISFMDADDTMHPEKLFFVNHYFNLYHPRVFIHGYSIGINNIVKLPKKHNIMFGKKIYDLAKTERGLLVDFNEEKWWISEKMHHGHVSISKDIVKNVKYREGRQFRRGQDSIFVRDILKHYGRNNSTAVFVDLPLSQYMPSYLQST